jgi:hypothetical protein
MRLLFSTLQLRIIVLNTNLTLLAQEVAVRKRISSALSKTKIDVKDLKVVKMRKQLRMNNLGS